MKRRRVDFKQAVQDLTGGRALASAQGKRVARREAEVKLEQPPGEQWQRRAWQLIERAQACLWNEDGWFNEVDWQEKDTQTGELKVRKMSVVDYLFSRGLSAETLRFWKIGYIPYQAGGFRSDKAALWGLDGDDVILHHGILIPWIIGDQVWRLKIKHLAAGADRGEKPQKYSQIRGAGGTHPIYMVQTVEWQETVVFCEGEFDALLLWQELGGFNNQLAGVVTLGSSVGIEKNNASALVSFGLYLVGSKLRLVAYDLDEAGCKGAEGLAWLGHSRRIQVPRVRPYDKDITDYWCAGGDLRAWIEKELREG
jgi:hypothetical protein